MKKKFDFQVAVNKSIKESDELISILFKSIDTAKKNINEH